MGETAPGRRRRTRVAAPGARPPIPSQGGRGPCHAVAPRGDEATTHRERLRRRLRGGGRHARAACRGPAPPAAHLEARAEGHAQAKLQTRARAGRRPRRSRGCAVGAGSLPPRGARRAGERLAALRRPAFARIRLRPCRRGGHPRESLRLSRHLRRWKDDAGTRTPRSRGDVLLDEKGRVHPYARALSVRRGTTGEKLRVPVDRALARTGSTPLPLGAVVQTEYKKGARWKPRMLTRGEMVLALLSHTVPARERPAEVLATLARAARGASGLASPRGSARGLSRALVSWVTEKRKPT